MNYKKIMLSVCGGMLLRDLVMGFLRFVSDSTFDKTRLKNRAIKGSPYSARDRGEGRKMRKIGFGENSSEE